METVEIDVKKKFENASGDMKLIIHKESKIVFPFKKDSISFGFNGSGKSEISRNIIQFINNLNNYNISRQLNYKMEKYWNLLNSFIKNKINNLNKIVTLSKNDIKLINATIDFENKKINIFLFMKGDKVNFVTQFTDTWFDLINTNHQNNKQGIFSVDKLLKKLNYIDKNMYNNANFIKNFVMDSKDFKTISKGWLKSMLNHAKYEEKESEKLIESLEISDKNFANFISRFNIDFSRPYFNYKNIDQVIQELPKSVAQVIFENIFKSENSSLEIYLKEIGNDGKKWEKILKCMYFISKIDQLAITDIHLDNGNERIVLLTRYSNFMYLSTNDKIPEIGILNFSLRRAYGNINHYEKNNQEIISNLYNKSIEELKKLETDTLYITRKMDDILQIQKHLFEISGMSQNFYYNFQTNKSFSLLGEPFKLSSGQTKIINLIKMISTPKLNNGKKFILILDDPVDSIDALRKRDVIFMVKKLNDSINKIFGTVKILKIIFTHDIFFLDDYSKINKIKKYNLLDRNYSSNTFALYQDQDLNFSESIEDIAYKTIKNNLKSQNNENMIPQTRIIIEWFRSLYSEAEILEIFKIEASFIEFLNRGSHFNNIKITNEIIKYWNKSIKNIIEICEKEFPKKFHL